jgi:hypothetical protein
MQSYLTQKQALRDLYNPVLNKKRSARLQYAAKPPLSRPLPVLMPPIS